MKNLLVVAALLLSFALPAHACDPTHPHGIHGHKLTITATYDWFGEKKQPQQFIDRSDAVMMAILSHYAAQTPDISFEKVSKESDANLVLRVLFFKEDDKVITKIDVYGLGKKIRLFSVGASISPNSDSPEDLSVAAVDSYGAALVLVFAYIDKGWECPKEVNPNDPQPQPKGTPKPLPKFDFPTT